jgi:hypothetical protein
LDDLPIYEAIPASASIELDAALSEVRKETAEEKRRRIRMQSNGELHDNSTDSTAEPLRLTAADPSFTGPRIPASDGADSSTAFSTPAPPPPPPRKTFAHPVGATGLNNLGNTCFMNSALQCLSNTVNLTTFFLSDKWKEELNRDNPLGMHGEVAESYALLVNLIWRANESRQGSLPPRQFKNTIGRFNQTFVGYSQQDSQELLQFLLDGLHEDLNRIKKKPYIEAPEMDSWPDEEIAAKSWEMYRARNDSAIVDLFQGEYKSRVECLDCGKWSVKFDPYMFLSLPVPETRTVTVNVVAVPGSKPRHATPAPERHKTISITLPRDSTMQQLKQKIAERMGWDESSRKVLLMEIYSKKVYKIYDDWDRAAEIGPRDDIFAYELVEPDWDLYSIPEQDRTWANAVHIPVYLSFPSLRTSYTRSSPDFGSLFGIPVMVALPADIGVAVNVHKRQAEHMGDQEWHELFLAKLGNILYVEVLRSLRRFCVMGLYRPFDQHDITGASLLEELQKHLEIEQLQQQKLQQGDQISSAEDVIPMAEEATNPPVPTTNYRTSVQVSEAGHTAIGGLFTLKYIQGDTNSASTIASDNKAYFYSNPSYRATTGVFYPSADVKIAIASFEEEESDDKKEEEETPVEKVDGETADEMDTATDSTLESSVPMAEDETIIAPQQQKQPKVVEEVVQIVEAGPDTTERQRAFNMRGELLAIAEFSKALAELIFGSSAFESSYSTGGLFRVDNFYGTR